MYHSLRILEFGRQILKYGHIVNFEKAKDFYHEIVKSEESIQREYSKEECLEIWKNFHEKYKPIHNQLVRELKQLCE
jgi:hypothetical protein